MTIVPKTQIVTMNDGVKMEIDLPTPAELRKTQQELFMYEVALDERIAYSTEEITTKLTAIRDAIRAARESLYSVTFTASIIK